MHRPKKNNADKAVKDAQNALDKAIQDYKDLTGNEPADNGNMPQTSEGDSNLNDQENTIIDSSGTDPGGDNASTIDSSSGGASNEVGAANTEEPSDTPQSPTSEEVAAAQQRVDEARIALDRAKSAQLQAALYLSAADDAASTESPSLQELEEALKNATAAADTKEREVKGIEAEIAAYAAELETATQQLKDAEARLANAPKLLQEAADAKAAFEAAEQSQKAASDKSEATFKAMKTAEGVCGTLEDQEDEQLAAIGKLNEEKTKINDDEVTPADTAYRTVLSTLDPSEYDTDRIAAINKAEEALNDAKTAYNNANTRDIEALAEVDLAKDKQKSAEQAQGRVNTLTYNTDPANLITEPGYEYLNDRIDAIRATEAPLAEKAQLKADAEKKLNSQKLAYDAATNELNRATAAAAAAQAEYDRLSGKTPSTDPNNPGGNGGSSGKPGNLNPGGSTNHNNSSNTAPKNNAKNLGNKGGNNNGSYAAGSKDNTTAQADESTVVQAKADTAKAPVKKTASNNGIDPLIFIVVGAIVVAAAAAIAAAVVRSRRANAQLADEEA